MLRSLRDAKQRSKNSEGFTLVELLVSLLVMGIMLSAVASLLKTFVQQVGKARFNYAERAIGFYWLNSTIGSMFFYTIRNQGGSLNPAKEFEYYFNGEPDGMAFITSSPLGIKGIALAYLYVHEGTLFLNETPIFSPFNDYREPHETAETRQIPLFENVERMHLTYFLHPIEPSVAAPLGFEQLQSPTVRVEGSGEMVETDQLKGDLPEKIRLSLYFEGDKTVHLYFRMNSDFINKKDQAFGSYHKF